MRQAFFDDPSIVRETSLRPLAQDEARPGLATPSPARVAHRRDRHLRIAVPLAAAGSVGLTSVLASAEPRLSVVVAAGAVIQALSLRHASTEGRLRGAAVVARSLALPTAFVVLALAVLQQPTQLRTELALLGTCAALGASLGYLLVSARRAVPRVVVVGDEAGVAELLARWGSGRHLDVAGALLRATGPRSLGRGAHAGDLGVPLVAGAASLNDFVRSSGADAVIVDSRTAAVPGEVRRLEWQLADARVAVLCAGETGHVAPRRLGWTAVDGTTFSVIASPSSTVARAVKSIADRVLALVLVVCFLPLLAMLALVVRLDSRGPAFFRQTRVGRDGATFTLLKLRTMTADAEEVKQTLLELNEGNGVLFKMRNDPRITRVGRWLRASSLDELPQLWNVVLGDMSLVGPRPALPEEVAVYNELERRRLAVKPGVTGPWQVSGRSSLSRERSMQLDAGYADNWHPAGDARILLRTIDAVLLRRGAF